MDFVILGKSF